MPDKIIIRGARVHNLKNIDLEIPKNKLVVITGLSGSGKSSLAFDTIYAEGQRRYAESMSSYARQFMETRDKPDVDSIEGLSPTIAIDQKMSAQNPRSTLGTVTEIYDYLRLLFARAGEQYCPECDVKVSSFSFGDIVEAVKKKARQIGELSILSPLIRNESVDREKLIKTIERSGYEWVRINNKLIKINDLPQFEFDKNKKYNVELQIGKIIDIKRQDPTKMVEEAIDLSNGLVIVCGGNREETLSTIGLCPKCGRLLPVLDMRSFSFNSPYGACERCAGLGVVQEPDENLIIPNRRLTLAEGAIQPWTRITGCQNWYQKILAAVATAHGFSLDVPVQDLSANAVQIVLRGAGKEMFEVDGKKLMFPGVFSDLLSRYTETISEYTRKEIEGYMREQTCSVCFGQRLKKESLAVRYCSRTISELSLMSVEDLKDALKKVKTCEKNIPSNNNQKDKIARTIIKDMLPRLEYLEHVGLSYLCLNRSMNTLSGGEVTRARLAHQLSSGLTGIIYVLDEPSVGLHPKDNEMLINTLKKMRDQGNSVIVVEHDETMMRAADYVVDIGPGAGVNGGQLVVYGALSQIMKHKSSLTGLYLSGKEKIEIEKNDTSVEKKISPLNNKSIEIIGAKANNLKNIDVKIPLGKLVCVTGVSGSGKSSLILDILGKSLSRQLYRAKEEPGEHKKINGVELVDKVIAVDQTPIGRTPRSNPATYTGVFTTIRDLFAELPEAKMHGYNAGKFSFNVKGGGRCEACAGEGYVRIPMQFLADVFVLCNECEGARYSREVTEIHYRGKNIADVLKMTIDEALTFFSDIPVIFDKLKTMREVGLGYVQLGQPATTLSGGEAQRIKLAAELARNSLGHTVYILDEPTTGLHFDDINRLLQVLNRLVKKGCSVIVIEHNLDIIRQSDWIIDLGPGGGKHGGQVVAQGTTCEVAKNKKSWTGRYL